VTLASILLLVSSPLLAIAGAAAWLTMGSPVFFRDRRAGIDGRPFDLLKFRSMRGLRPGESIPESDAARITKVGALLRRASLDELPSFLNVVAGDMALVGLTPLPVRYVDHRTLRLDIRILVDTVQEVVRPSGIAHEGHATMPEFERDAPTPGESANG
jgi:lipopolysaccharide/colanic/teichoic acid biosynthesis glycosyltransferase